MVRSVLLSTAMFLAKFGLQFVSIVVLARLLSPETYGVFAIVLVFIYLLEMVSELGLRSLVLTKEGAVGTEFLRTCWTLHVLRGAVIFGVVLVIASGISLLQEWGAFALESAYAAPVLPLVLVGVGASQMLGAVGTLTPYLYEREMRFGLVTFANTLASAVGLLVTIGVAVMQPTVWALVIGTAVQRAVLVAYGYMVLDGPGMRFCWDRDTLRIVRDRGRWLWSHSILTAATNSADRLLVGIVADASTFGLYFIARRIVGFCAGFLNLVDTRMGLQVFTHLLSVPDRFQRNYYGFRLLFDVLAGAGAGLLWMLAPLIVEIVFDDRYAGVAPFLQVLGLGLLLSGPLILRQALGAERDFRKMTALSIVSAATLWTGLFVALFMFGSIEAAILVIVLHRLPETVLLLRIGAGRGWIQPLRESAPFLFFAAGMGVGRGVLWLIDALA